jgi:hypothetical protein
MENSMANRKKAREVIYSGIIPVAQKPMVTRERAAVRDSPDEREAGEKNKSSTAPTTQHIDIKNLMFICPELNLPPI